jgi:hypothetical protein
MLTPYGAETRDKSSYALLLIHWIFDTAIADYGKGRIFAESSWQSCFSKGKENGRREDIKSLNGLKHFDKTRD